jgi:hypothetical protein
MIAITGRSPWSKAATCLLPLGLLGFAKPSVAQDFALSVSPPRFELVAQPGQTVRAVAELSNASSTGTQLSFATAEWELTPDGGVVLTEALKPGSCRQLRYRFEVTPPTDAKPTECRFAIVVSGADATVSPTDNVRFPLSGQIALIVYVSVGDVKPRLRITKADVIDINGSLMPVLLVENTGTAHGRLAAFLNGTDAKGVKREFTPSTLPVLPGETRRIVLNVDQSEDAVEVGASAPKSAPQPIAYPLKISGTINDTVSSFKFEGEFEP